MIMNQETDNKLEAAIRGTKVSNRTEWLILAPILVVVVLVAWFVAVRLFS
jgi:hypothetical protein